MGNRKNNLVCVALFLSLVLGLGLMCIMRSHNQYARPHTQHASSGRSYEGSPEDNIELIEGDDSASRSLLP